MKKTIYFLLLFSISNLYSQTISGKLIDAVTKEPIEMAHIYSKESKVGTISNANGEFILMLPERKAEQAIMISHIGYQSLTLTKTVLNGNTIEMIPDLVLLEDVVVGNDAYKLAEKVLYLLRENSQIQKFGKAFFRQYTLKDDDPKEWVEAFLNISYSGVGLREFSIKQARIAKKLARNKKEYFLSVIDFMYFSFHKAYRTKTASIVIPFSELDFEKYHFYEEKKYTKGRDSLVKVVFVPHQVAPADTIVAKGNFLYNKSQNQLIQLQFILEDDLGIEINNKSDKVEKIEITNPVYTITHNFTGLENNFISGIDAAFKYDLNIDDSLYSSMVKSRLIIYEWETKRHRKLLKPGSGSDFIAKFWNARYRPRFWRKNPVMKLTREEKEIIRSFKKDNAFGTYFKGRKKKN